MCPVLEPTEEAEAADDQADDPAAYPVRWAWAFHRRLEAEPAAE